MTSTITNALTIEAGGNGGNGGNGGVGTGGAVVVAALGTASLTTGSLALLADGLRGAGFDGDGAGVGAVCGCSSSSDCEPSSYSKTSA